jgi:ABC-type multidrug transport system fused ATPase/permease subunit
MLSRDERIQYWDGLKNKATRYYWYQNKGLSVLNEARYLILSIMAIYALLKLDNPWIMLVMFLVSLPVLTILGWIYTFKMAKTMDFLNVKFSTHFSKYSIELQEEQNRLIKEVIEELRKAKS